MVRIDNGSEMSLAKQYFDDLLVSIKQQDCSFSRTKKKKKKSNHSIHVKGSLLSGQITTFWLEIFCQHQLENYFGRQILTWGL